MSEPGGNRIFNIIKIALETKKVSLAQNIIGRLIDSKTIRNMRKIVSSEEVQVSDYRLFLEKFREFLDKEFLDKKPLKQMYDGQKFRDIASEDTNLSLKQEGFIEDKITEKKENAVHLNILIRLTTSTYEELPFSKILQISNALGILNKLDFFQSDVSTKMDAIIFSLSDAEPSKTAEVLVKLNGLNLLTENNFNRIYSNFSRYNVFSSVFNKLDLIGLSGGSNSLLTQANLDKLLDNSGLNLDVLAKFIKVEDESKILTQEKFDLAINLKNLLTQENIDKIEKAEFDHSKLANVLFLSNKDGDLQQDTFDTIMKLKRTDFINFSKELSDPSILLTQESFSNILKRFNETAKDQGTFSNLTDEVTNPSANVVPPKTFLDFLIALLNKIVAFLKNMFNVQNKEQTEAETNPGSTTTTSLFFKPAGANSGEATNPSEIKNLEVMVRS